MSVDLSADFSAELSTAHSLKMSAELSTAHFFGERTKGLGDVTCSRPMEAHDATRPKSEHLNLLMSLA